MYAIVKTGGKQYKVEEGNNITTEKINHVEIGDEIVFDKVLLVANGDKIIIGNPIVKDATVIAKMIAQKRAHKVLVFKKKPKKGYKKLQGHRQYVTELKIIKINIS
ncbi:MAG: 50S ribosomal protein L21 [Endomicrobium sp.]|jgi:large subunit ribosomal protein L21|nr:50S ribosomal protein L21 [Endomicrobium sp.]